jgi:hypothetical protein
MKALRCCKLSFLQARRNPKFLLCLLFLILQMWQIFHGFPAYARALGWPHISPWTLPLLPGVRDRYPVVMLAFLMLVSDLPLRTAQQKMVLQRIGKQSWIRGQLLYLLGLCLAFTLVLWILSWIFFVSMANWIPRWGKVLTTVSRHTMPIPEPIEVSPDILRNTDGLQATLWTAGMQVMVCFFLGCLVLLCNLWTRHGVGVLAAAGLVLLSFFIRVWANDFYGHQVWLLWLSPVSWVDRSVMGHVNQNLPSFTYGTVTLIFLCLAGAGLAVGTIHRCSVETE